MKHILITGANGFVGSRLASHLYQEGYHVTALVRPKADTSLLHPTIPLIRSDYSRSSLITAFHEQDAIIHTAALVRALSWKDYQLANVSLTESILAAYHQCERPCQFLYLSSQAAAGMAPGTTLKTEDDPCTPISDYGRSKRLAEQTILHHSQKPWTIIRPVSVYGPGDKDFLTLFRLGKHHINIHIGKSEKHICLIHVDELVGFIKCALESSHSENQIFFASDGAVYQQQDFMEAVQQTNPGLYVQVKIPSPLLPPVAWSSELVGRITGKAPVFSLDKMHEIEGANWKVSIDKAKELLAFQPQPNLVGNIRNTREWYIQNGWL